MPQPNIVLLVTDDQAFESLSRLPSLFRDLANKGVFFSKCFANTPLCMPARATLLTGQHTHNHGITWNGVPYETLDEATLLPKVLQDAGYTTSFAGKYLNDWSISDPIPVGWNDWHGTIASYYNYPINDNGVITTRGSEASDYHTTVVTEKATAFIETATEPFFLKVGYKPPHVETTAAIPYPDYENCLPASKTIPKDPNWNLSDVSTKPDYIKALPLIDAPTEDSMNEIWRSASESMFSLDKSVMQIKASLVASGKDANTVIILVSDNGEMNGEQRLTFGKIVPYEPSIHIPLIISGPSAIVAQNRTCSRLVAHVDIAATIYALSGVSSVRTLDGVSLTPLLLNPRGPEVRSHVFIEWRAGDHNPTSPNYYGVRSHDWKYVEYETGERELYNLQDNPYELTNTAELPENVDIVAELSALVAAGTACTGGSCVL